MIVSHLAVHTGNDDNPMEAPEDEIKKFEYISDPKRRKYAGMRSFILLIFTFFLINFFLKAMMSSLDQSVGQTVKALSDKAMLNNTIILLYSDNGAPTLGIYSNGGSNYPFRGVSRRLNFKN